MALVQNHYEINVSKDGRHLFATAERSLTYEQEAKKLYELFVSRFPEKEGYKVTVSHVKCGGYSVDWAPIY